MAVLVQVLDAASVEGRGAADDTVHDVALAEQVGQQTNTQARSPHVSCMLHAHARPTPHAIHNTPCKLRYGWAPHTP